MSIKQKISSLKTKLKSKTAKLREKLSDAELGAEEVTEKEIFPPQKKCCAKRAAKTTAACKASANKKPSKRTRPTNNDYTMIDKDNESCDCNKS